MKPFGAQKGHVVDFLFTLALFCVFAASALMVVVIGANVYRQTVRGMDSNYDSRTSLTYLTEKVRQNDAANAVTIRSVGDSPALVLSQQAGERIYETWIYVYDGYLRELDPTGNKVVFEDGKSAPYDFSKDLRRFAWGLQLGGEWKAFKHLNVYADLTWGMNDIFKKDFNTITFAMYPIYLNMGFGYAF